MFPFLTWRVKLSAQGRPPLHGSRETILALAICWRLSFLWENVRQVDQNGTYEFHIISQLAFWGTHESGVFLQTCARKVSKTLRTAANICQAIQP